MKISLLVGLLIAAAPVSQMPKNDPTGTWQADSGSRFAIKLTGEELKVSLVSGSNPRFKDYEVNLKLMKDDQGRVFDVNTYQGKGHFTAKMQTGKECSFDIDWQLVVIQPSWIVGKVTSVDADGNTCEVKDRNEVRMDLKKVE